jgi:PAS domain S-box-containing protein
MAELTGLLLEFAGSDDIAGVSEGLARAVARCTDARFAAVVAADADGRSFDAYGDPGAPWRFLAHLQGTFNRGRENGDPAQRAYRGADPATKCGADPCSRASIARPLCGADLYGRPNLAPPHAVTISDVQKDDACRAGFAATSAEFGIQAIFAMPIDADGICTAVAAAYFSAAGVVSDASLATLAILAAHGGAAMARARRFERLEGEAEQHQALVSETAEGICTFNDRMDVVLWNRAAERITGVRADEIVGEKLSSAFSRVELPARPTAFESFDALAETFASAPSRTIEVALGREHAEPVWLSMAGATVGGRIHRRNLVCCFRDITEQKRLDRLRSEFVSLVTHQLRTPLTAIRGYAELLGAVEMPPDQVMEFGTIIAKASTRLASSITDVMDFERLAASRDSLHVARLRLVDVLDAALEAAGPSLRHEVSIRGPVQRIILDADLERLTRAFAHLVGNADRYWPGDGQIVVTAAHENGDAVITVVDRGPGIADNAAGDLFSPYHHAARKRSNASQGMGLGLALSKRIVEAHGGQIEVGQTPGGGTTVRVRLPAAARIRDEAIIPSPASPTST